jgi:3-oxoacyl-[acyl-carrier protein] reductase
MAPTWGFASLAGRRVLVTGASVGIGAAVAQGFADCGSRLVLHYNRNADAARELLGRIRAGGGEAEAEPGDLATPGVAADLVARAAARLDGLDILVNVAGDMIERRPATETPDDLYRRIVDLNLTSVFEACRAARPWLSAAGDGVIVNTTSIAARNGGGPGAGVYAASKAAVSTLTRALARELAPHGVRVNAVAPGFVRTSIHDRLTSPAALEAARQTIPLRRVAAPQECVGAYLFLADNSLSGYVTGQILEVSGGLSAP